MSKKSFNAQTLSGLSLLISTIVAVFINNSLFKKYYCLFETIQIGLSIDSFFFQKNLVQWTNDGLMSIYFLLVGLEIKREFKDGELAKKTAIAIPAIVAFFGLSAPALIYIFINKDNAAYINGWAIPVATDIVFSMGLLSLFSSRIPSPFRIIVLTIAIFDDIATIIIIAVFYSKTLSIISLIPLVACILFLLFLNYWGVKNLLAFISVGIFIWLFVMQVGFHPTIAGVIVAFTIPHYKKNSPLLKLENVLNPWVLFGILPLFAFFNTGVNFIGVNLLYLFHPVSLGIILGLFIGKQIGIFSSLLIFYKMKYINSSYKFTVFQLYIISLLCSIGFTMSLFTGNLSFRDSKLVNIVQIGVLIASAISGLFSCFLLKKYFPIRK